ncbi:hypothetical protein EOD14_34610 [Mesorhizobium sp. M7A.T.Ca.US.000.02.1.1]|uniref:hypothetical protein n=1 Tax=Mesorhizobium sp. M7A.T.Ca.US.000.02.1.1 TaxID=2496792 RepID=UPI000FD23F53|nr:hypothetical protein [Mesorhizobium sp. M7A.T.Ca.US.000.02.1.1]RUT78895.1 hypothetical protein EOD14_34610 [Mesorhizobium sp. M7A.T.Ca.US.000.02.1.1]
MSQNSTNSDLVAALIFVPIFAAFGWAVLQPLLLPFGFAGTVENVGASVRGDLYDKSACNSLISADEYKGRRIVAVSVNGQKYNTPLTHEDAPCRPLSNDPRDFGYAVRYYLEDGSDVWP